MPTSSSAAALHSSVSPRPESRWQLEVESLFAALSGAQNRWSEARAYTTMADAMRVRDVAALITPEGADEATVRFFEAVIQGRKAQPPRVRAFFDSLADDWYAESPLYYTYPHSMGVHDGAKRGTLEDLRDQLPYLRSMGFRNIQLLPHWKSPGGDGGYDISGFVVDPDLGGEAAFRRLMNDAMALGIRVITDFIPNHISSKHPWFEAVLQGDESKLSWFHCMDDVTFIGHETDEKGRLRVLLQDGNGVVSKPWAIFPFASKKNLIDIEVNGKKHQIFHSFYPFQVDLNLKNPELLGELFKVLAWEASLGVAGKRMDAAPHTYKEPGTNYENLRGTHAVQEIFKLFYRHVVQKGITVPEVGEGLEEASSYFGERIELLGKPANSEGDVMFGFEWNSTMWGVLLDENVELFWAFVRKMQALRPHTFWFNLSRHHDELRTDLIPNDVRERIEAKLLARGAEVFAGRGVGGRMANFLEEDPRQISKAFWLNFMPPNGTPVVYYGDEVGAQNQPEFMVSEQQRRLPILKELGFPTDDSSVVLDKRDVGRGGVPASLFAKALNSGYLPLRTLRALNALWAIRPSLRHGAVLPFPVEQGKALSLVKWAKGEDSPLLGLCNLGDERVIVRLPAGELRGKLFDGQAGAFVLEDILARHRDGVRRTVGTVSGETDVELVLEPHEHLLVEAKG